MVKKNEKIQLRDEKLNVIFDAARIEAHEMVKPLIKKCNSPIGLATAILKIAYMWAQVRFIANSSGTETDDVFDEMVEGETKVLESHFGKEIDKSYKEIKNKE